MDIRTNDGIQRLYKAIYQRIEKISKDDYSETDDTGCWCAVTLKPRLKEKKQRMNNSLKSDFLTGTVNKTANFVYPARKQNQESVRF